MYPELSKGRQFLVDNTKEKSASMTGVRKLYGSSNSIVVCNLWLGRNSKRYVLRSKDPWRLACRVNLNVISHSMKWIRM